VGTDPRTDAEIHRARPIYEEGNLIKRTIRDLYNREIDEVLVEGEAGYRTAKDFMKMIMPSHAKAGAALCRTDAAFRALSGRKLSGGMFNPTVQLKSGGYIVIGVTEALVAIDVNSGRDQGRVDRGNRAQDQPRGRRRGGPPVAPARPCRA
jgi:Rne/Rng family ribonuclease